MGMNGDDLYVNTAALTDASGDLATIATALAHISELVKTAQINLADYDSPKYSAEIKSALANWITTVGDPDLGAKDGPTMISRMNDFSTFLTQVASTYTS